MTEPVWRPLVRFVSQDFLLKSIKNKCKYHILAFTNTLFNFKYPIMTTDESVLKYPPGCSFRTRHEFVGFFSCRVYSGLFFMTTGESVLKDPPGVSLSILLRITKKYITELNECNEVHKGYTQVGMSLTCTFFRFRLSRFLVSIFRYMLIFR